MIKQMFKLIWNRKRTNFLMITGLFISFVVLFIAMVIVNYNLNNYVKPLGFSYENVWKIGIDWKRMDGQEVRQKLQQMEFALQSFPEVKSYAQSRSLLFMPGSSTNERYKYGEKEATCEDLAGGDQYPEVLNFKILEGRWFNAEDNAVNREPLVINKYMKEEFFPQEDALGKILTIEQDNDDENKEIEEFVVIGVIDEFRFGGEFTGSDKVAFRRISFDGERYIDFTDSPSFLHRILVRVEPGTPVQVEERLLKQLTAVAKGMSITVDRLEETRRLANKSSIILPIILSIVCGFLVINVALGLFGMIWYHTNQRTSEIGLRRAAGATAKQIYFQILGESWVLSTFAMIIGSFFALQLPILDLISFVEGHIYYISFVISIIVIYIITTICALYPSKIAAQIQPAVALHYE